MTTFKSFTKGVTGRLKGEKAISKFDRELEESLDEAWGTKRSKKRKGSKKKSKR